MAMLYGRKGPRSCYVCDKDAQLERSGVPFCKDCSKTIAPGAVPITEDWRDANGEELIRRMTMSVSEALEHRFTNNPAAYADEEG